MLNDLRSSAVAIDDFSDGWRHETHERLPLETPTAVFKHQEAQCDSDYRKLRRIYSCNRAYCLTPGAAYQQAIDWALQSERHMLEHCQTLLDAVSNPMMLEESMNELRPKLNFTKCEHEWLKNNSHKWEWLRDLGSALKGGTFTCGKYRKRKIPKPGSRGFRTIEIPDTPTRIVSKTLLGILSPLFDTTFEPFSIGFRPERSCTHGFAAVNLLFQSGFRYYVKADIRDAFGQIPKKQLLDLFCKRLHDSPVIPLIDELFVRSRTKGIPQGLSISPLAMNLYLDHYLDRYWKRKVPETTLIRYADDILIACRTKEEAQDAFSRLQRLSCSIQMPIKESQADALFDLPKGDLLEWLGIGIRVKRDQLTFNLTPKSWNRLTDKFAELKRLNSKKATRGNTELSAICRTRITEKAIGISDVNEVQAVAKRMRKLANEQSLDLAGFTNKDAIQTWERGQRRWQDICDEVEGWLP